MSDEKIGEDALDENLRRLLPAVVERQAPDPAFRERLLQALVGGPAIAPPATPPPRRRARWLANAVAFAAAAALVLVLARPPSALPPLPSPARPLPADAPALLVAPAGRRAAVALEGPGATLVARIELRDGASLSYWPGTPALARLQGGYLRLEPAVPFRVLAGDVELAVQPGSAVLLELVRGEDVEKGERSMRPLWLVPSAAAGAGLTLAVLVARGQVSLMGGAHAELPPAGQVAVLKPHEGAPATRRVDELEKKVAALKQENARLAGTLAQKKGVTGDKVRERIAALKSSALPGLMNPGALTDLETDLKGLGPEGVKLMIDLLGSADAKERFLAAKVLEDLNAPAAIGALKKTALEDSDRLASSMASHALAFMDDPQVVPALRAIADANKTWESRVNALWGLCKLGEPRALDQALAIMKDEKETKAMRGALGGNLLLLPDPALLAVADETLRQFGSEPEVARLAIGYYKSINVPEGTARLQSIANDPKHSEEIRKAAREALARP
jgi:HEAT repeat protein